MLIEKAVTAVSQWVRKASRGSLGQYVLNAPHQYGQPYLAQADAQSLITPARMREVVLKTPTAAAGVNAILDYATNVSIQLRNLDSTKKPTPAAVKRVNQLLRQPNPQDTQRSFFYKLFRDLATLGFAGVELERNASGGVANLWVLDAGRLKVDYDQHGTVLGYDMLDAHGYPIAGADKVHAWLPENVIWFQRSPRSDSLYPSSQIAQLFTAAVIEDYMLDFIGGRFNDSNVPFGIYDMGDITPDELKKAIALWNSQHQAQHRIMLTGSKSGGKWTPFGYHLKDLEAPALLALVRSSIMGVLGVTENEIGQSENVNKSNGYNLSYTFKKRAIEPLLYEVCETLTTRLLWDNLGFEDSELYYAEIDSRDELLQAQIDDLYHKMGVWTTNHIRNRKGQPNEQGGDLPMLFTGSAWIPVSMANDFAYAQLMALLGVDAQMMQQVMQAQESSGATGPAANFPHLKPLVSAPLVRPMQEPEKYTGPDTKGSQNAKIRLPKPDLGKSDGQIPQAPRGPTQTLRNQGMRKEDTHQ